MGEETYHDALTAQGFCFSLDVMFGQDPVEVKTPASRAAYWGKSIGAEMIRLNIHGNWGSSVTTMETVRPRAHHAHATLDIANIKQIATHHNTDKTKLTKPIIPPSLRQLILLLWIRLIQ